MKNDGTLPDELNELIQKSGLPLIEGVLGIGFMREHSLDALDILAKYRRSAVLGGDVYEVVGGKLKVSYDNWHCDPQPGEDWASYVERSIKHSRDYISSYTCAAEEGCVFLPWSSRLVHDAGGKKARSRPLSRCPTPYAAATLEGCRAMSQLLLAYEATK